MVEDSILFDNVHVGAGACLKRCIVDKNVKISPGERIGFDAAADAECFTVSESGVTVVPKEYRFPDADADWSAVSSAPPAAE